MTAYLQADDVQAADILAAITAGSRACRSCDDNLLLKFVALLTGLLTVLFCTGQSGQASAQTDAFRIEEVSPGNYVHYGTHDERSAENLGDNANIGFIVGDVCVLVFDTGGSFAVGEALRTAIRRVTDKPVCYVIISHVHPDHIFGAAAFLDEKPEIIGHQNLPRQLAARGRHYEKALERDLGDAARGSQIVLPTKTLAAGASMTVDLGGREIEIRAWKPAHTDDDVSAVDLSTSTLWLGDLLFVDHTPVLDSNITGFLSVMKKLRELDFHHYVAGHGRSDAPWPAVMDLQQQYFEVILVETRRAIRENVRLMDAVNEVGYSQARQWINFETYHRRNVTTAYTELEWE